jgi:hypothetical protein
MLKMFKEAIISSSQVDPVSWITAVAFGAVVASGAGTSSRAHTIPQRVLHKGSETSPWAGISSAVVEAAHVPISQVVLFQEWYFELSERMAGLAMKQDGWKGPESLAALPTAFMHANRLLRKLAVEGVDRRPSVGLDYEGTFSFTWFEDEFSADLTVYDDGTYSFFASDGTKSAAADEALVSGPLPAPLLGMLLS